MAKRSSLTRRGVSPRAAARAATCGSARRFGTRASASVVTVAQHIVAQIVDDGHTPVSASTLEASIRGEEGEKPRSRTWWARCSPSVRKLPGSPHRFRQAGYRYHGRVAALANGARRRPGVLVMTRTTAVSTTGRGTTDGCSPRRGAGGERRSAVTIAAAETC